MSVDAETRSTLQAGDFKLDDILSSWEQRYIDAALKLAGGNLSEAARSTPGVEHPLVSEFRVCPPSFIIKPGC